jgi:phage terminase small subunit
VPQASIAKIHRHKPRRTIRSAAARGEEKGADLVKELTPKQETFCEEYLVDLNATQAAIRAGYSEKTAKSIGQENLTKPDVLVKINELKECRSERTQITADTILTELLKLATVDLGKAFDASGTILPINEMPEEVRKAISSIEVNELFDNGQGDQKSVIGFTKKIKFWDKPKCLELLGKHLKLFTETLEVNHKGKIQHEPMPMKTAKEIINKYKPPGEK